MPSNADLLPVPAEDPHDNDAPRTWRTTEEVAAILTVDPSTLRRWRTAKPPQGPPFVRLTTRLTLYNMHDLQQWLADHRIDPGEVA
ncbi:helix-turn-helix domain-containing protein [Nonomuraea sp. NPDC005692]|uniref:helix-turn-helix transcriptional regulator n=1 Tax=Nonomuraea sp. NPDC005692 TaxID=3157168 RepID=UPI0033FF8D8B